MATYIEMPKLSDTMTEGTLVKWRKNEGEKVTAGDVVAEIETDKATMEMEAFDDGILHKHLIAAGAKVPIGSKIALLLLKGETPPAEGAAVPRRSRVGKAGRACSGGSRGLKFQSLRHAGPLRFWRASEGFAAGEKDRGGKSVDLTALSGSGPGGRIVAKDVEGAKSGNAAPATSKVATPAPVAVAATPAGQGDQRITLSGMRRVIAERLLTSKATIPHFYLNIEVDAAPLMKFRAEANAASEAAGGVKYTVNDFVLKAVVAAAVKVPAVNASFAGDAIIQYGSINLCVAVAVEEGLVTPVIRAAQTKSLREISAAVKDLATRARNKKLKPEEYQGGTITVSNLGSYGIDSFSAIINPPQALIISVGAIVKKPVVGPNDAIAGQRMAIGLSADHRVVDGAVGAQYLAELRKLIESPALMLF